MFGLVPFMFNNPANREENTFPSVFDVFNEPFFQNAFAPMQNMNGFKVDVKDTGDSYELTAELPGTKKEDIQLDYQNDYLTIKAVMNKEQNNSDEAHNYICKERYYGTVQRSFYVGQIDKANAKAEYTDGVLKITLPKLNNVSSSSQIDID
ncbi:Hsp20/alpha crystallin family protein [Megamonas hypermegale]|uniref:Hsp20/alpha crystallin family protein n=1 Tax=Megamonas hypermegale TaxID=158847 RepID=UPI0026E9F7BD|nr:Hsp20/alpha crystallin family protein [Megamonas hypermegale]